MSAPVTNGVLRTKLSDMKVGDYIKWYYRNFSSGVIGEFSQTPSPDGTDEVELSTTYNGPVVTPTDLGTGKTGGYFYFVKVDSGMLLSDRAIQPSTSARDMNKANVFKGSIIRLLTYEEFFKIKKTDLNGNVIPEKWMLYDLALTDLECSKSGSGSILSQDLYITYRFDSVHGSRENKASFTSSAVAYNSVTMFVPVMEYVDNSKSTNIFY